MRLDVDISGSAIPRFPRHEITAFVRESIAELRRAKALDFAVSEVSIAFIDDRQMRRLNSSFRGERSTTDVLTFEGDPSDAAPGQSSRPLGEIMISVDRARRQAREQRHSLPTEIRYLLLHGLIHALGFDHETDEGAMDELEMRMRRSAGLE